MSARNKKTKPKTQTAQNKKRKSSIKGILVSDLGPLPAYFTEEYHDMIREADRKLGRLMKFSGDLLEDDCDREVLDWKTERARAVKMMDRYSKDAFKIIVQLAKLIHAVRDSKRLIELCDAECVGKMRARQKLSNAELAVLQKA